MSSPARTGNGLAEEYTQAALFSAQRSGDKQTNKKIACNPKTCALRHASYHLAGYALTCLCAHTAP